VEAENTTYIYLTVKCHFVHHKFNIHGPETEPGPPVLMYKRKMLALLNEMVAITARSIKWDKCLSQLMDRPLLHAHPPPP
jgi:hypothetical protein